MLEDRTVRGADGRDWQVLEAERVRVLPATRAAGARDTDARDTDARRPRRTTVLYFVSPPLVRCLGSYPPGWRELDDERLAALGARATPAAAAESAVVRVRQTAVAWAAAHEPTALASAARDVCDAMRRLCAGARREGLPVEHVVIAVKRVWATLPGLGAAALDAEHEGGSDRFVSLCIETYYDAPEVDASREVSSS